MRLMLNYIKKKYFDKYFLFINTLNFKLLLIMFYMLIDNSLII